ncbi:molybdenum cofactor guanylyltransferase MobA [Erwinia psidii]|uniref:Molybdenum cofactor guanylyltransferase MobA n=1 Tax=Erwinia psidii TaxID=69224 RepID=A0A3N6UNA5_9GAMM|nr:molybdenum cofactor guanylyltransferase MobA [Erwinia psidii]RQM37419.1 molybdenum cofactor guanylyltransferase MobA [Erwinia psidii]
MGGKDKGLIVWREKPLWQHVLSRLAPQTGKVCINANRNMAIYRQSGLPVIGDSFPGFAGPLAGMLAALEHIDTDWAAFSSCDTPALPSDLVSRLWQAKQTAPAVWSRSAERDHPVMALLHVSVAETLAGFLAKGGRKVMSFFEEVGGHSVSFDDVPEAFTNINCPGDLLS